MKMVRSSGAQIISQNFDLDCTLTVRIGISNAEQLKGSLLESGFNVSD
jgi:hypothetical protein